MDAVKEITMKARLAKSASRLMARLSSAQKEKILRAMAEALLKEKDDILFHNSIDVEAAKEAGLSGALVDRLTLNDKRVESLAASLVEIAAAPDPIGEVISEWTRPIGIRIRKIRVPLGVVGMIYESRPNVTVDAVALCIKSGNACILKGGTEALNSNHSLIKVLTKAGYATGLPESSVSFIETADRSVITEMLKLDRYIDLIIPRGSEEMIRFVREHSVVPVLAHGKGLCHTYIDKYADIEMAKKIAFNAKCQRPGVCNAMETLLVHKDLAKSFLPEMCRIYKDAGVEVRGCEVSKSLVPEIIEAQPSDWSTEYLDMILSVKVVNSVEEAIDHINLYGSGHSESIVTEDKPTAAKFLQLVDAAAVFHNASTRLHDGGVFGLGAEIGISTQKLHARGTMGAKELTTTKYVVYGTGQIRE